MKHDYFAAVPIDYTGYSVLTHSHGTRVTVFKGFKVVTAYSRVPKRLIEQVAAKLELYLHGEISMHTGKQVYKVGKVANDQGGVINLFSTESRAAFNRFVCTYVNTK